MKLINLNQEIEKIKKEFFSNFKKDEYVNSCEYLDKRFNKYPLIYGSAVLSGVRIPGFYKREYYDNKELKMNLIKNLMYKISVYTGTFYTAPRNIVVEYDFEKYKENLFGTIDSENILLNALMKYNQNMSNSWLGKMNVYYIYSFDYNLFNINIL